MSRVRESFRQSFTAKDTKDTKEENSLTAKAAKDAKRRI